MKRTEHALNLINSVKAEMLATKPLFFPRKNETITRIERLFAEIQHCGNWSTIPYLVQFLTVPEYQIIESVLHCISALMKQSPPTIYPQIEYRLRAGQYHVAPHLESWHALKSINSLRSDDQLTFGLLSFHQNGYIRQAAIKHLSTSTDGGEVPFLLLRLDDWVSEVQNAAHIAVKERVSNDGYISHFIDNFALIDQLIKRQRFAASAEQLSLTDHIFHTLLKPKHRPLLLYALQHKDFEVRRCFLQTMYDYKIPGLHEIIKSVIRDKHPIIRQLALNLSERLMHLDRIWVLNQMTHDTSARIRLECLRSLSNELTQSCIENLTNALLDRSESVRRFAQWKLKDLGEKIDFRQFYSQRILNESSAYLIAAAVDALGEIGKPQDAVLLVGLMLNSSVTVRKSAIKAIARLDAKNYIELFEQQLQNEAAGVSRAACDALLSKAKSITLPRSEDLWMIFSSSQFQHVKINVLRLLNAADLWDRIAYCLLASANEDQLLSAISINHLKLLQKHSFSTLAFTKPSKKQLKLITEGMKIFPAALPPEFRQWLEQSVHESANRT